MDGLTQRWKVKPDLLFCRVSFELLGWRDLRSPALDAPQTPGQNDKSLVVCHPPCHGRRQPFLHCGNGEKAAAPLTFRHGLRTGMTNFS